MSRNKIVDILKRHTGELMSISGVVGIGAGKSQGKPCIMVFVVERDSELLKQLPDNIEGYPVQVEESGKFRALGS
jgi:hypothetical protein